VSLTEAVRSELAATELGTGPAGRAELSGLLRFSGVLLRRGGRDEPWTWMSTLRSIAARRADRQVARLYGTRCELRARQVTAPRPMLLVELEVPAALLEPLGLQPRVRASGREPAGGEYGVRASGREPAGGEFGMEGLPGWLRGDAACWAYVRGVALAGLRLSGPARPHCEIQAPNEVLARQLAGLLERLGVRASPQPHTRDRWRVVSKSRPAIGTLLAGTGATDAYLRWEDEGTRRSVRGAAARGVNADRANAQRSVRAATTHVAMVVDALSYIDVDALPEELRTTALARLANPTASLGELAALLDVSKATVSRRLRRLAVAAERSVAPTGD
jgi:DNA-binding transcriptional regulator WhiA